LFEVERLGAESGRAGPEDISVARGLLLEEDLGSPQLFRVGVTVVIKKIWRWRYGDKGLRRNIWDTTVSGGEQEWRLGEEYLEHNCFRSVLLFGATFRMSWMIKGGTRMKTGRRDFSGGFCNSWTRGIVFCCEVSLAKWNGRRLFFVPNFECWNLPQSAAEGMKAKVWGRKYS
jgi:hypothetical protein